MMRAGIDRLDGFFPVRFVFALFGVLILLANASPGTPHNVAAFFTDGELVYDIDGRGYAVAPRLDRDKRQRAHPVALAPNGKAPLALAPPLLPVAGGPAVGILFRPDHALLRFYHLDERTSPSRAPPILL